MTGGHTQKQSGHTQSPLANVLDYEIRRNLKKESEIVDMEKWWVIVLADFRDCKKYTCGTR